MQHVYRWHRQVYSRTADYESHITQRMFPLRDIIRAMVIVRRIRGNIVGAVLCCVMHDNCDTHTRERFLKMNVDFMCRFRLCAFV